MNGRFTTIEAQHLTVEELLHYNRLDLVQLSSELVEQMLQKSFALVQEAQEETGRVKDELHNNQVSADEAYESCEQERNEARAELRRVREELQSLYESLL